MRVSLLTAFMLSISPLLLSSAAAETLAYFGTYTRGKSTSEGIYVAKFDETNGYLSDPQLAAEATNPSFVAIHPDGTTLYSVSEIADGDKKTGGVTAFSIKEDGTLKKLNNRPSGGAGPCHVAVDPTGQCVVIANYGGGSCASFPLNKDGSLGEQGSFHQHEGGSGVDERRQAGPHAHSVNINADGTQAFVADLGLDQILMYDLDAKAGKMKPSKQSSVETAPGGGPRHFCFHPSYRVAYTNLELSSQVSLLTYNEKDGTMTSGQTVSTLPANSRQLKNSTAECLVHPSGRYLYVSNRGHNSIAAFAIDPQSARLSFIENESTQGEIPRGFGISPSGRYVVVGNQNSGNVVSLAVDAETGALSATGHGISIDAAVNVRFLTRE